MHRVGGLEKANGSGNVSYDAENHELMVKLRAEKVAKIASIIPPQQVSGPKSGQLLVVSWGGTYGACHTAVQQAQAAGLSVAHCHLRHMNPFPSNLSEILRSYEKVLVPELNLGQLRMLLRDRFLINAIGLNKVKGKPFAVSELVSKIREVCSVSGKRSSLLMTLATTQFNQSQFCITRFSMSTSLPVLTANDFASDKSFAGALAAEIIPFCSR